MIKQYLGIDLGGTEVKLAIVDMNGKIVEQCGFSNSYDSTPEQVVHGIVTHSKEMKNYHKICSLGIGVAGDIDQKRGVVRFSPNMSRWKNVPLKKMIKAHINIPIVVDNDANVAAWGAYWLDTKGEVENLICITLGTGIGGGIICNDELYRGAAGSAGEIGHITLDPDGLKCNCGNTGCIERYVGAKYLGEQAIEEYRKKPSEIILKLSEGNLNSITPFTLTQAAKLGDHTAIKIWETAGERLGIIIADLINIFNPQVIVLAGGVSKANDLILEPIKKTVKKRAFKNASELCQIIISKYDQKLGVAGAAFLAR